MDMKSKILIILSVIVVVGVIIFVFKSAPRTKKVDMEKPSVVATSTKSQSSEVNQTGIVTENNAPVVISSVTKDTTSVTPAIPAPNFSKPLVFPATFTDAQKKDVQTHVDQYVAELKKDKLTFNAWIDLGLYRKNVQDYQGAFEAWNYASLIQPTNALPVINTASLYGYDVHDQVKAEKYYLKAIGVEPTLEYGYFVTAMYYQEVLNDIPKAISIVEKGIKAIPSSLELRSFKSSLQESIPK
jgi:hypothetical protein